MNDASLGLFRSKPKIAIVGPGVVGQATGKSFLKLGFNVSFIGVDKSNIETLRKQKYQAFFPHEFQNGSYKFDATFLTVPTPTINGRIDLSAIKTAAENLGKNLHSLDKYHLVVVKSTVLPGVSEHLVIPAVEKYSGKKAGVDFGVCMNPEYLRAKTADQDALEPWVIVIGEYDRRSGDTLSFLYRGFDSPVCRLSLSEAEIQKYIHNLFNAVKITFFNEMREIGKQIGADTEKIFKLVALSAEGIWNHRYGLSDQGPFSGVCLPKDTQAFLQWVEVQGWKADVLKAAIKVNDRIIDKAVEEEGKSKDSYISAPP